MTNSDAWNSLTIAAGDLERARNRLLTTLARTSPDGLGAVVDHLEDVINDVAATLSKIVEMQEEDRLDRARYDREVAEDLRDAD